MTDSEIIKGLECCEFDINDKPCEKCPYYEYLKTIDCISFMASDALSLIERLQERVAIQQEPCKYCDATENYQCKICTDKINGGDVAIEAFKNEWTIRIEHEGIEEYYVLEVPINYCPMCGRDLKEDGK